MRFAFGLSRHADVAEHAARFWMLLSSGKTLCDGAWPADGVRAFRHWIDAGKPAWLPGPFLLVGDRVAWRTRMEIGR